MGQACDKSETDEGVGITNSAVCNRELVDCKKENEEEIDAYVMTETIDESVMDGENW